MRARSDLAKNMLNAPIRPDDVGVATNAKRPKPSPATGAIGVDDALIQISNKCEGQGILLCKSPM